MKKLPLLLLLILTAFAACVPLRAQEFDLANSHLPLLSLDGQWRFHKGDDPAWAAPGFDDSSWALLRSDTNWADQGHHGYSGMAWYRFQVDLPAGIDDISLYLPYILTSYEVYANGQRIGAYGKMPPNPVPYWGGGWFRTYPLPALKGPAVNEQARRIVIAIRVWHWPGWSSTFGGGPSFGGALIGQTDDISRRDILSRSAHHWDLSATMILALLQTLAGIGALALFLLRRSEREYLWFGIVMLAAAASGWLALSFVFNVWNELLTGPLGDSLTLVAVSLAEIAFYRHLLKGKPTLLFKAGAACILLTLAGLIYNIADPSFQASLNPSTVNLLETLLQFPAGIWILVLLFVRARQNWLDARLLLAPVLLQKLAQGFQGLAIVTYNLGWQDKLGYDIALVQQPFQIELLQAVDALFLLAMLAILVFRFTRTRSQAERYAAEFDAARSVQQILIPEERPQTPGLTIESEYHPAREVGGDFFQVLPHASDGSTLIVVGDVAGKGLQAGMLVAHIVGVLRSEARHSIDPERILAALNEQLCGRNHALATCLALRIAADGSAALANAGHLPPYLNGKELPMEGALPLGAIAGIEFPLLRFQLAAGDSLMLMTDGIAEAMDSEGRLFGFERITELLGQRTTAAALAAAAQKFGQEDDITVLTIERATAAVPV
jgi:hypothetical protein